MDPSQLQLGIPTSTLLAMAAMFLGLAVIVQVVQEIYKFLTTSKASVYRMVLEDFFGSWVEQLYGPGPAARFHVRGPFQWFKSSPTGKLLPLSKDELLQAIDELPTGWMGETLAILKEEVRLERISAAPVERSPAFRDLVRRLQARLSEGSDAVREPGDVDARRMLQFLDEQAEAGTESARVLLERFFQRFFPDRVRADEEFERLAKNFQFANERRNLRYSFLFGLVVAILLNFPFDAIFARAQALSPEAAVALVGQVDTLQDYLDETGEEEEEALRRYVQGVTKLVVTLDSSDGPDVPVWCRGIQRMKEIATGDSDLLRFCRMGTGATARVTAADRANANAAVGPRGAPGLASYFLHCLVTALLVSFGAPFWDRVTDSLLTRARRQKPAPTNGEPDGSPS